MQLYKHTDEKLHFLKAQYDKNYACGLIRVTPSKSIGGANILRHKTCFVCVQAYYWHLLKSRKRYEVPASKTIRVLRVANNSYAESKKELTAKDARRLSAIIAGIAMAENILRRDAPDQKSNEDKETRIIAEHHAEELRKREEKRARSLIEAEAEAKREADRAIKNQEAEVRTAVERHQHYEEECKRLSEWLTEVYLAAEKGLIRPGLLVTVKSDIDEEKITIYLADPDPLFASVDGLRGTLTGYKTYIPKLPVDVQIISTSSSLGKEIKYRRVGDRVVVNAPAGKLEYTIVGLKVAEENEYKELAVDSQSTQMGEIEQRKRYEGSVQETPSRESAPSIRQDVEGWSDGLDAGKYTGFMARDGGSFGSLSSFDDYSDEANP